MEILICGLLGMIVGVSLGCLIIIFIEHRIWTKKWFKNW